MDGTHRLCICPNCGPRGELLPPTDYARHRKRQRRREDRMERDNILASIASTKTTNRSSQSQRLLTTNHVQAVATQPASASAISSQPAPRPSPGAPSTVLSHVSRQPPDSIDLTEPDPMPLDTISRPESPEAISANREEGIGLDDNFFAEEDEDEGRSPGSDLDDDPIQPGEDPFLSDIDDGDRYGAANAHERQIGSRLVDADSHPPPRSATLAALPRWHTLLYVFILWLGSRHQLSDNVLSLVARFISTVLLPALHTSPGADDAESRVVHTTPRAIRKALGLEPTFIRYIVCPRCSELYPWALLGSVEMCTQCKGPLLQGPTTLSCSSTASKSRRPQLFYTVSPIRTWLEGLLRRPDVEAALDQAFVDLNQRQHDGVLRDISDGTEWAGAKDQDGQPYASHSLALQITLNIDWFSPFKVGASSWHSSGTVALMLNNLPGHLRHEHIHLAAIMPGPSETTAESINKLLLPIVEEMLLLEKGVRMTTARDGRQRLVRARFLVFCGDAPARCKVCGFPSHRADQFCPNCTVKKKERHLALSSSRPRSAEEHRRGALASRADQAKGLSSNARDQLFRLRAARWSVLYLLPYWRSVNQTPPDAMHCVFLGITKRFWHKVFVDAICGGSSPLLAQAQVCVAGYKGPLFTNRPDKHLGNKGGGNPNADQWCCLGRNILVFAFATLFDDDLCQAQRDDDDAFVRVRYPPKSRGDSPRRRPHLEGLIGKSLGDAAAVLEADEQNRSAVEIVEVAAPTISTASDRRASGAAAAEESRVTAAEPSGATPATAPAPASSLGPAPPSNTLPVSYSESVIDALVPKRDIFLLAMHVAAIAEIAYAPAVDEGDLQALERLAEGHLLLHRQISPLWPTVNTHFVLHLAEFIRKFGPCREWWAFSFERLNGWLSQAAGRRTNKKRDGQVEYGMMRAWWHRCAVKDVIDAKASASGKAAPGEDYFWTLLNRKGTQRSTIDAQADERIYATHPDYNLVVFGLKTAERSLPFDATQDLVDFPNSTETVHYAPPWSYRESHGGTVKIRTPATLFQSMMYKGLRFVALEGRANRHEGSTFAVARRNGELTALSQLAWCAGAGPCAACAVPGTRPWTRGSETSAAEARRSGRNKLARGGNE